MYRGFTLIELMITAAVAALLLGFGLPSFARLLADQRGAAALNQMIGAVAFARAEAIVRQQVMTLCPARAGVCLGRQQWHQGAMAFADDDGDGRLDPGERVGRVFPALHDGAHIYWRSFRSRSYLQFRPRGYTRWQNGSLLYCPPDNDPTLARLAIVNAAGRIRVARDRDGDGIVENAGGDDVTCPP